MNIFNKKLIQFSYELHILTSGVCNIWLGHMNFLVDIILKEKSKHTNTQLNKTSSLICEWYSVIYARYFLIKEDNKICIR